MGTEKRRRRRIRRPEPVTAVSPGRRFRALVREALADLPPDVAERIDNVAIIVRGRPTAAELRQAGLTHGGMLLGLYQGTPLSQRNGAYGMVLPDRIHVFRASLEAICHTDEELVRQIRHTVLHELAHHFGISDERLHQIGAY